MSSGPCNGAVCRLLQRLPTLWQRSQQTPTVACRSCTDTKDLPQGMRPEEIWRSRGVDGYNRQTIAELVALVEDAAQPPQVDLPWALPRLSLR